MGCITKSYAFGRYSPRLIGCCRSGKSYRHEGTTQCHSAAILQGLCFPIGAQSFFAGGGEHFFRQWGAWKSETPFHSVFDGLGAVLIRELPEKGYRRVFH